MAHCQRCGSRSALRDYCPKCRSLDPFPWRRRLMYLAILGVFALAAFVIVLAVR